MSKSAYIPPKGDNKNTTSGNVILTMLVLFVLTIILNGVNNLI